MGIFDRFRGKNAKATVAATPAVAELEVECPHIVLTARWDSVADMGKDELASAYICGSCRQQFTPEDARILRESTAERLRTEDIEQARERAESDA